MVEPEPPCGSPCIWLCSRVRPLQPSFPATPPHPVQMLEARYQHALSMLSAFPGPTIPCTHTDRTFVRARKLYGSAAATIPMCLMGSPGLWGTNLQSRRNFLPPDPHMIQAMVVRPCWDSPLLDGTAYGRGAGG